MPEVSMSLAEKIGQLFMVGFEGTEVTPELAAWMATYGWGGVILFGRNVGSPAQVLALTHGLQTAVHARGPPPLLIAVDQEGGRVARLKAPFTAFPSAAMVGHTGSERAYPGSRPGLSRPNYVLSASRWTWHLSWMSSPIPPIQSLAIAPSAPTRKV